MGVFLMDGVGVWQGANAFCSVVGAEISGVGRVIVEDRSSLAGYGSAGGQPERRAVPKGLMPRVVVRRTPHHDTHSPRHGPLAQCGKLRGFGGWPPWSLVESFAVVLGGAPLARADSRGGRGLVGDTFRQAVAAAVDGDDLGAVQQPVEDGSGGGNVS